jgi:anti-sigma factor RsiW
LTEGRRQITEQELHAYVDGALDRARRLDVALYLARSPVEAARVESFRAQKEGFHVLFDDVGAEPLPRQLRWALLRRLSLRALRRLIPFIAAASIAGLLLLAGNALNRQAALLHHAGSRSTPVAAQR